MDFEQGRDTKVINDLNRFLSDHAHSPREREARGLLAQSYERSGKIRAALKQYQMIAQTLPPGQEKKEVAKRIDELEQRLNTGGPRYEPNKVVRASLTQFYTVGNDPVVLKGLRQDGVTSVLIDFECPGKGVAPPQPTVRTSDVSSQSQLPSSVNRIHRQGLLVFVGINLRCLGYLDSRSKKAWLDGSYNPVSGKVQSSPYFDIFHPQYQQVMVYEINKLTDNGIDGVVFLAEVPLGMYDGFRPGSVDTFNKAFHTQMNPHTLFENGVSNPGSQFSLDQNQPVRVSASKTTEFWRWTGWKARQRLIVLQGLMDQVHEHKPKMSFGLELHSESIEDPLRALTQFSEDFLEAQQRDFEFFFISPQTGRKISVTAKSAKSQQSGGFFQSNSNPCRSDDLGPKKSSQNLVIHTVGQKDHSTACVWFSKSQALGECFACL